MQKVAILIGGGLGDCIWQYFTTSYNRKLLSVKEKHDLQVTCYVHSHNDQAVELLRYNPHIYEVCKEPYMIGTVQRAVTPLPHVFNLDQFEDQPMPIYLAPGEQLLLDQVTSKGDYVVVHPFAGEQNRSFAAQLPYFIDSLVERGLNVVVVGGSHRKSVSHCKTDDTYHTDGYWDSPEWTLTSQDLREEYTYTPQGVANLVDIAGVRLSCELVHHAKYFIGTHSCYQMAAWYYQIPSFCLLPDSFPSRMIPDAASGLVHSYDPYVTHLFHPGNKLMFFSEFPHIQRFLDEFIGDRHGVQHGTGGANENGRQTISPRPRQRHGPRRMLVGKRHLRG